MTRLNLAPALIVLYVVVVGGLALLIVTDAPGAVVAMVVGFFLTQWLFLFGSGSLRLQRPIKTSQLRIPAAVGALLMAILSGGMAVALMELYYLEDYEWAFPAWLAIVVGSWFVWGLVFLFVYARHANLGQELTRMTGTILGGSLITLLVTIAAHGVVMRRGGCLVGMGTTMGIGAGLVVMLWVFGPGLVLLFLNEKRRHELRQARRQGRLTAVHARDLQHQE